MKFLRGLKLLLTNSWYNFSFILALVATAIISAWIMIFGSLDPNISDFGQGLAISVVVSFQYFILALVVFSLIPRTRALFFEGSGSTQLRNQVGLSVVFIIITMVLSGVLVAAGPYFGVALAFGDALITAYFAVLLGWNLGKTFSGKLGNKPKINWILFGLFLVIEIMIFGLLFEGFLLLPLEQQVVMLMFPLLVILLPIITVFMRNKETGPEQATIMGMVLLIMGVYYTLRLSSITAPQFTLIDLGMQAVLLIYGLSSTTAKVHEDTNLRPMTAITVLLIVILARVGAQVNRLLAAATGWGDIVQVGITSLTILNLAILGLLAPVYWMWSKRKNTSNPAASVDSSD
ncbi:MAG: hypothetical protein P1Q69_06455 [Candidatus Thorarchaeota archaeon]|nr:hypothetical protein [Candidatus Thorarchaeota archaeon]